MHSLHQHVSRRTKYGILGVIGTSEIEAGTGLYPELTMLVASSDDPIAFESSRKYNVCEFCCDTIRPQQQETISCNKYATIYCNDFCRFLASGFYHRALCGQDFGWLYDVDRTNRPIKGIAVDRENAAKGALWLRVLALCVQADCHPLDHSLTSQCDRKVPRQWSLSGNIDRTRRRLPQLGIHIFTDQLNDMTPGRPFGAA